MTDADHTPEEQAMADLQLAIDVYATRVGNWQRKRKTSEAARWEAATETARQSVIAAMDRVAELLGLEKIQETR